MFRPRSVNSQVSWEKSYAQVVRFRTNLIYRFLVHQAGKPHAIWGTVCQYPLYISTGIFKHSTLIYCLVGPCQISIMNI